MVTTRDRRQAYAPEIGQTSYDLLEIWLGGLDKMQSPEVSATVGEWANMLMTPTYPLLATCRDLTSKFRTMYLAITHDVMLRRMKKSGLQVCTADLPGDP